MGHKDFAVEEAPPEAGPTFTLAGRKFTAMSEVSAGALIHADKGRDGLRMDTVAMHTFIRDSLMPGEETAWDVLIEGKSPPITTKQILGVFEYLVEEYQDRPFPQPSGSSDGPTPTEA